MLSKVLAGCAVVGAVSGDMMYTTTTTTDTPFVCPQAGQTPEKNSDENVGYVQAFYGEGTPFTPPVPDEDGHVSALLWPYALDVCTATSVTSGTAVKAMFTCVDGGFMYKTFDTTDPTCTGSPTSTTNYNSSNTPPFVTYNCDSDRSEAYVSLDIAAADSGCTTQTQTYGALNSCTFGIIPEIGIEAFFQWYCLGTEAELNFFYNPMAMEPCADDDFCVAIGADANCALLFTTATEVPIYAKVVDCMTEDVPDDDDDSAANAVSMFLAVVVASLAVAFN